MPDAVIPSARLSRLSLRGAPSDRRWYRRARSVTTALARGPDGAGGASAERRVRHRPRTRRRSTSSRRAGKARVDSRSRRRAASIAALDARHRGLGRADRDNWRRGSPRSTVLEREIPGVGPVLAATIAAEAADVRRFTSAKAFGRYTGMIAGGPKHRRQDAARVDDARGKLPPAVGARPGRGSLRAAPATALAFSIGEWLRAKQRRMGCKAKARVAAARKLAEAIWRLFQPRRGLRRRASPSAATSRPCPPPNTRRHPSTSNPTRRRTLRRPGRLGESTVPEGGQPGPDLADESRGARRLRTLSQADTEIGSSASGLTYLGH